MDSSGELLEAWTCVKEKYELVEDAEKELDVSIVNLANVLVKNYKISTNIFISDARISIEFHRNFKVMMDAMDLIASESDFNCRKCQRIKKMILDRIVVSMFNSLSEKEIIGDSDLNFQIISESLKSKIMQNSICVHMELQWNKIIECLQSSRHEREEMARVLSSFKKSWSFKSTSVSYIMSRNTSPSQSTTHSPLSGHQLTIDDDNNDDIDFMNNIDDDNNDGDNNNNNISSMDGNIDDNNNNKDDDIDNNN